MPFNPARILLQISALILITGCAARMSPALAPVGSQNNAIPNGTTALAGYVTSTFMPSSAGRINAFQVFDATSNGVISSADASQHGWRYSSVWGARSDLAKTWRTNNSTLRSSYYLLMDTDQSTVYGGPIGHTLSWWQSNHPSWVMYACTSAGVPTKTPAYDTGLPNVPLNISNPAVVNYQITNAGAYAVRNGYNALAIDQVTFWFSGSGGPGYYPCGTWNNGTFVKRYASATDQLWASDVATWVQSARTIVRNSSTLSALKIIVSHPGENLTANEMKLLANVDAVMDETGFTDYGRPTVIPISREVAWMQYAQAHGVAVLINQGWSASPVSPAQLDFSIATYLLGNEQAASLFVSAHAYGLEQWHGEYQTLTGSPCAEYYASSTAGVYYRKFQNVLVVVNGSAATQSVPLVSGHTYSDLELRTVHNPLSIASGDGYVLQTSNGCQ